MNADFPEGSTELPEQAREKLAEVQERAKGSPATVTEYIRANPWTAVAVAVLVGGLAGALCRSGRPEPSKLDAAREWLDDAYRGFPTGSRSGRQRSPRVFPAS